MRRIRRPAGRTAARAFCWLAAAPLVGAAAGCREAPRPIEPPPPLVGVVESRTMDVPIVATPFGTTRALQEVSIRARVRGFLTEQHFEEGSYVKKGQLLLVIEEAPYKIALESARARQAEAEAALAKAKQSKARETAAAKLALDQAQLLLAQIEERRTRALLARNAASREDFDRAEAERKKSAAQIEADQASLDQARTDYDVNILAAQAQLDAARASVQDAELNLGYCRMYAPFDGRIGEAKIKVGNLVGPANSAGMDVAELASIQQLDPMGIDIQVSSSHLDRATDLMRRNAVIIRLTRSSLGGEQVHSYLGEGYFIDNTIDPTTSTFLVRGRIPNPQHTLLPGEYVKLRIEVDSVKDAVVVPEQAVMETQEGPVVYVVGPGGKVDAQRVEAAQTYDNLRVVPKGLAAGVPVVVEGLQLIRPGAVVQTEPAVLARPARNESRPATPDASDPAESNRNPDPVENNAGSPSRTPPPPPTPGGPRSAVRAAQDELPENVIAPKPAKLQ